MHLAQRFLFAASVAALARQSVAFPAVADRVLSPRPPSPHPATDEGGLELLHVWADLRGIRREVAVCDEPSAGGGRGLVALRDLGPGEVAVRVPLSATIRVAGATRDEDFDDASYDVDVERDDNWAGALASRLCHQDSLAEDSSFWEYVHIGLPRESPRTVCRWTSSERLALQDDALVNESFENAAWRRRQLTRYRQSAGADNSISSKKFLHYLDLVCSRTLKGRDGSRNLVPIIDNANHLPAEAGGGAFVVDADDDSIRLIVGNRGARAGEAVTLDYGGRRSEDYLLHYGFVPDRCPGDSVLVPANDGDDDIARISWGDCGSYGGHADESVRSACASLLRSFETSLGEDVELLSNIGSVATSSQNEEAMRAALNHRIAKKSLLSQAAGVRASAAAFSALR